MSKYSDLKKEYDEFDKALMKQGRLPLKDTGIGFWNASSSKEVFELFKKIKLNRNIFRRYYKNFIDF